MFNVDDFPNDLGAIPNVVCATPIEVDAISIDLDSIPMDNIDLDTSLNAQNGNPSVLNDNPNGQSAKVFGDT